MRLRHAVMATLLVAACGCASPPGVPLPSHDLGADGPAALIDGQATGDEEIGCVWIDSPSGGRVSALWPPGYRVSFEPLTIYDETGKAVAAGGTTYGFGGGHLGDADALPEPCRTSRTWSITSIGPSAQQ